MRHVVRQRRATDITMTRTTSHAKSIHLGKTYVGAGLYSSALASLPLHFSLTFVSVRQNLDLANFFRHLARHYDRWKKMTSTVNMIGSCLPSCAFASQQSCAICVIAFRSDAMHCNRSINQSLSLDDIVKSGFYFTIYVFACR